MKFNLYIFYMHAFDLIVNISSMQVSYIFLIFLVIFSQNVIDLTVNQLFKPAPFLQPTASSLSDLPPSNHQPMD